MNPDRIKTFSLRRSQMQQQIYGRELMVNGTKQVKAILGPVTHRAKLEEGGFLPEVDAIVRIPCNMLLPDEAPQLQDRYEDMSRGGKIYIVEEIKDDPQSTEWVIGVRAEG